MTRFCALCIALMAGTAHADRFTLYAAGEGWNDEVSPAHGVILLAWETKPLWRGGRLSAEINTETLRFGVAGVRVSDALEIGADFTTEFLIAGLLPDYFQNGQSVPGRGFYGSYVKPRAYAKARLGQRVYLELEVGARRWRFERNEEGERATDDALALPPSAWVFEPRLRYTWWNLEDDAAFSERHRLFPRHRGLAFGVEFGADGRSEDRAWGARNPDVFDPVDPRNAPEQVALRVRQWLKGGWQMHPRVRTEIQQSAAFGSGEDDLSRDRIGGSGPYVTPVFGAPWASWLSERYVAGQWSWHFRAYHALEVGPAINAIVLSDPDRVGDEEEADTLFGAGLLADWRFGQWQVDLRGGWSPSVSDRADLFAYNVWLGFGRQFTLGAIP